jgi:hypothetical protein
LRLFSNHLALQAKKEKGPSQKLTFNMKKLSVTLDASEVDKLACIAINDLQAKVFLLENENMRAEVFLNFIYI